MLFIIAILVFVYLTTKDVSLSTSLSKPQIVLKLLFLDFLMLNLQLALHPDSDPLINIILITIVLFVFIYLNIEQFSVPKPQLIFTVIFSNVMMLSLATALYYAKSNIGKIFFGITLLYSIRQNAKRTIRNNIQIILTIVFLIILFLILLGNYFQASFVIEKIFLLIALLTSLYFSIALVFSIYQNAKQENRIRIQKILVTILLNILLLVLLGILLQTKSIIDKILLIIALPIIFYFSSAESSVAKKPLVLRQKILLFAFIFCIAFFWGMYINGHLTKPAVPIIGLKGMSPKIENGDVAVIESRSSFDRGLLVFCSPHKKQYNSKEIPQDISQKQQTIIGRIIGMPSEEIEFNNSKVFINGKQIIEEYVLEAETDLNCKFIVPINHYFILKDHRKESKEDSRTFGAIDQDDIYWIQHVYKARDINGKTYWVIIKGCLNKFF